MLQSDLSRSPLEPSASHSQTSLGEVCTWTVAGGSDGARWKRILFWAEAKKLGLCIQHWVQRSRCSVGFQGWKAFSALLSKLLFQCLGWGQPNLLRLICIWEMTDLDPSSRSVAHLAPGWKRESALALSYLLFLLNRAGERPCRS
jgi:hypothetical protein